MNESQECHFGREIRIISNLMRRNLDKSAALTRSKISPARADGYSVIFMPTATGIFISAMLKENFQ